MAWTDDNIDKLTRLWEAGVTASAIAEEIGGVSRNAVVGKAHRLGLSARLNPVETDEQRFERLVDMVADFDAPIDLAADTVRLARGLAVAMWAEMCRAGGRQYA